jgi:hypothetical protein
MMKCLQQGFVRYIISIYIYINFKNTYSNRNEHDAITKFSHYLRNRFTVNYFFGLGKYLAEDTESFFIYLTISLASACTSYRTQPVWFITNKHERVLSKMYVHVRLRVECQLFLSDVNQHRNLSINSGKKKTPQHQILQPSFWCQSSFPCWRTDRYDDADILSSELLCERLSKNFVKYRSGI